MSSKKYNFPVIDSDDDDDNHYMHTKSVQSYQLKSPQSAKQPWKPSQNGQSLRASQIGGSQMSTIKKVHKPKFTLPSQSCAREKQELKHQICHLEESIKSKNQKIRNMKQQIAQEQNVREEVAAELKTQQEWRDIAEQLRYDNHQLKQNELKLYSELQEQQVLTKEALNKLYELREEQLEEKENLRQMYEQYAADRVQEEKLRNMDQINNLLDLNDKLKQQVVQVESQISAIRNQEKLVSQVQNYKSSILRKKQLQEIEDQKEELLRQQLMQRSQHTKEMERLKLQVLEKEKQLLEKEYQTAQKERLYRTQNELENSRRFVDAQMENEFLRRELDMTQQAMNHSELKYKAKKNELNSSFGHLQSQLSNLKYDIEDIKHENRKILHTISPRKN